MSCSFGGGLQEAGGVGHSGEHDGGLVHPVVLIGAALARKLGVYLDGPHRFKEFGHAFVDPGAAGLDLAMPRSHPFPVGPPWWQPATGGVSYGLASYESPPSDDHLRASREVISAGNRDGRP